MVGTYVIAAELHGHFTGRPEQPLRDMMISAAKRALDSAELLPEEIDALYAGAMGNFEPEGFVGPIPVRMSNALGLCNADVTPMLVGSSEAGAWALKQAFEAIRRSSSYRNIIVVAGEQMNPLASATQDGHREGLAERKARNRAISEILDEHERQYGLNMVRAGDLIMDVLRIADHWDERDIVEGFLPLLAMTKYERIRGYPLGHLHGRVQPKLSEYWRRPSLSRYFNVHDVTPTSSGAVALVLSSDAKRDSLEILGMGQAIAPISLASRPGDPRQARSIRTALSRACRDAGVDIEWLLACDFGLIHDAFPSIEYAFLKELGLQQPEIIDRSSSGWSNPFGGLKACGHALGASGLLQIAKAYHRMFGDPRYLSRDALDNLQPAERCFASSVGGPLTNVVVSVLQRSGTEPPSGTGYSMDGFDEQTTQVDDTYHAACEPIPAGQGLVLAATHIKHMPAFGDDELALFQHHREPWVHLIERDSAEAGKSSKTFAFSEDPLVSGSLARLEEVELSGVTYAKAIPIGESLPLPPNHRTPIESGLRVQIEQRLTNFGSAVPDYLPTRPDFPPELETYAIDRHEDDALTLRAIPADRCIGTAPQRVRVWLDPSPEFRATVVDWSQRRATISHRALEAFYGFGSGPSPPPWACDDAIWIRTALVGGLDLQTFASGKPLPTERLRRWSRLLIEGLSQLHAADLVLGGPGTEQVRIHRGNHPVFLINPRSDSIGAEDDRQELGRLLLTLAIGSVVGPSVDDVLIALSLLPVEQTWLEQLVVRLMGVDGAKPFEFTAQALDLIAV